MANIIKITKVISRIFEVLCFIGAVGVLVTGIFLIASGGSLDIMNDKELVKGVMTICGTTIDTGSMAAKDAAVPMDIFMIVGSILYALMGMIFRNVELIVRTSEGQTWFSKGMTPFQGDNVRMVREIGIFAIAIPVVGWIAGIVIQLAYRDVEMSTAMLPIVFGIIIICLSKIFEYGTGLQKDEDGLI